MARPATGGSLGATMGAVITVIVVVAAMALLINFTGGLNTKVRLVDLTPQQRAAAERAVSPTPTQPAPG
jgi:hypothetical protein